MLNDISSLLLTIAGASASFVAILGGFIASKLIAINGERESCKSHLEELKYEKMFYLEKKDLARRALQEEDALSFIYAHLDEAAAGVDLDKVYEEDVPQVLQYEELLLYWEKAQFAKELFDERLKEGNCEFNEYMIPYDLAKELAEDIFAYRFLQMYASVGFSEYVGEYVPHIHGDWYEKVKQESLEDNTKAMILEIQETRYKEDLLKLHKPKGLKIGLLIFALFSFFNIALPPFLCVTAFPKEWNTIVAYWSIGMLVLGLGATFWYLAKMLRWKK